MKFRKRPVVVEAIQWVGSNAPEVLKFILDGREDYSHLPPRSKDGKSGVSLSVTESILRIPTLEGVMNAMRGDWIVKGVKGEFYPVKPDIFKQTYELVAEPENAEAVA